MDIQGEYQTRSRFETANVPAGRFQETVCITTSTREGRRHQYFQSGLGVVMTRIDGPEETTYHELVNYRILP